jgi:hypothetical protein
MADLFPSGVRCHTVTNRRFSVEIVVSPSFRLDICVNGAIFATSVFTLTAKQGAWPAGKAGNVRIAASTESALSVVRDGLRAGRLFVAHASTVMLRAIFVRRSEGSEPKGKSGVEPKWEGHTTERAVACTVRDAVRKGDELYFDIDRKYNGRQRGLHLRISK